MSADQKNGPDGPIRPYQSGDEDAYINMWLQSTIPGQSFLPEQHWRDMEPDVRGLLRQFDTWVIDGDHGVVAALSLIDDLIGGLFVHPQHQGSGLGTRLVEHARSLRDPLYVEVFEANERAIEFYRRLSFHEHESHVDPDSGLELLTLKMHESDRSS